LTCFGKAVGCISFVNPKSISTVFDNDTIIEPMVQHLSTVLERLLLFLDSREKRLEKILSNMPEGLFLIDQDGQASPLNSNGTDFIVRACRYDGEKESGNGDALVSCAHDEGEYCNFTWLLDKARSEGVDLGDNRTYVEEMKGLDGRVLQLTVSRLVSGGSDEGYIVTARDVTDSRLIQKRLFLSSKLTALGEMAAGIAHEVNNPLQMMMGNVEILKHLDDESNPKVDERLDSLKDGVLRIKGIIRNLLVFAREQTTETENVDINPVIMSGASMLREQLKLSNINIELELDSDPVYVRCNKNLLQQVLINLIQNARDAMEEAGKGSRIYVRTNVLPSTEAVIEVSDDGPGMSEEIAEKIFDPFFTTKDVGKGTGLGLSVSRRIIEGMGGSIAVTSHEGGSTSFYITLLTHVETDDSDTDEVVAVEDYSSLLDKTVLMVDDEVNVTDTVSDIIGSRVSSISVACNGREALDKLNDADFDLLLVDIKMPEMDGMEFYKNLKEYKPYMAERIIFLTGDTENEKTKAFLTLSRCHYLSKPFETKDLLSAMVAHGEEECDEHSA
ncbi:MAG: ATP-binding protein, partial [Thermodesulfobacteriota bacterium]